MHPDPFESAHPAPAGPRPTRWWLWLLGALLCALAVVAVFQTFVRSSTGQVLEYRAFQAVEPAPGDAFGPSPATTALTYAPYVALGCAALGVAVQLSRRRWQSAVAVVAAAVGANVTTQVLKHGLERPYFDNGVPYVVGNSLPSGHTTLAATAAAVLLLTAPVRWRPLAALVGAVLTGVISSAAFLEAWHRPSDMVAAVAVAAGWAFLAAPFVQREDGIDRGHAASPTACEVVLWAAGILGVTASAVLLGMAVSTADPGPSPGPIALTAGVVICVTPAPLAWAALVTSLRHERRWQRRRTRRRPRPYARAF
ncbi:phosphoesterase, PA-phosphatase related [Micrococcus lylae]|uniref:Phosphoesterase, PA-phosphatase related n=1 Tax=Micrococcus lylae TaxID=1273 RepID=A0A1R4JD06_9MICC|nr:phosphatase PAP2 family protein [Micrococcus lylae]SJN29937.1 phosphoesterase, PA-phosphatase related [Micrococcus lylae]